MKETEKTKSFRGFTSALFAIGFALIIAGVIKTVEYTNGEHLLWLATGTLIVTAIIILSPR